MSRPTDKADRYLNYGLTNRLFKSQEEYLEREEIGKDLFLKTKILCFVFKGGKEVAEMGDLAARNIQRGRDHGSREVKLRVLKSVNVTIFVVTTIHIERSLICSTSMNWE